MDPEDAEKKPKRGAAKKETKKTSKKGTSDTDDSSEPSPAETLEVATIDGSEQTIVETPENLALSEALDDEFSDTELSDM